MLIHIFTVMKSQTITRLLCHHAAVTAHQHISNIAKKGTSQNNPFTNNK